MTREEAVWYVNHTFEIIKEELCNSGRFDEAKEFEIAQNMAIEALSADAVSVVRCGECKLGGTEDCPMDEIDDEYFCNFGERREP